MQQMKRDFRTFVALHTAPVNIYSGRKHFSNGFFE